MYSHGPDGRLERLLPEPPGGMRRQDLPKVLVLNGAFYFVDVARLRAERRFVFDDSQGHEMSVERSLDIDTKDDFAQAEHRLASWGGRIPESGV